ncbi:hypothetical protein P7K49_012541 [Saguinus oedipus]|uniref:Uncharacterized protein n=1 Tax=Saguinus oedipus TaxID=9490 RepID=A0ABQ9VVC0_SAGOE|nr:hypothetical protein P7K49_012541 [Saguinus oedipus]
MPPYRTLLCQATPRGLPDGTAANLVGKERPSPSPKYKLPPILLSSPLVTTCPHQWMDQAIASKLLPGGRGVIVHLYQMSFTRRASKNKVLCNTTEFPLWSSPVSSQQATVPSGLTCCEDLNAAEFHLSASTREDGLIKELRENAAKIPARVQSLTLDFLLILML